MTKFKDNSDRDITMKTAISNVQSWVWMEN